MNEGRYLRGPAAALLGVVLASSVSCAPKAPPPTPVAIAVPYEVDTLDPHAEDRLSSFAVLFNVYESLVDMDGEMRIRPALALTWESPDPVTWIFRLRPSVRFHSGRPLRAADVAYTLGRLRGAEALQVRNYTGGVAEVHVLDDLTLKIRTSSPSPVFLAKLRHVAVVPEGSSTEALRTRPDGTGPYAFAEWQPGRTLTLRRNESHWGGPPDVAELRFTFGSRPEDACPGVVAGRYQLAKCDSRTLVPTAGPSAPEVLEHDSLYIKYLAFDLARPATPFSPRRPNPFQDVRVRRAVAAAIDRKRLVAGLSSAAAPATQPVPHLVFGFDPGIPDAPPDPERARALLRAAGMAEGFDVVLHGRPFAREALPLIQQDLRAVGIRAETRLLTDVEHFALLEGGGLSLWLTRIGCGTGDASELLDDLIHSRDPGGRFGSLNDGGYSSPKLDEKIERAVALGVPESRRARLQEIMRAVLEDQVLVPLYNDRDVWVLDRSLSWAPRNDSEIRAAEIRRRR